MVSGSKAAPPFVKRSNASTTSDSFLHNDEGNLHELHAVKWHFPVEEEGDQGLFFDAATLHQEPEGQQLPLPPVIDTDVNGVNHSGANEFIAALT